jgi:hypothetical protein
LKKAVVGLIPEEIINRPKRGFGVPIRMVQRELRELLHTLTDKQTRERPAAQPARSSRSFG